MKEQETTACYYVASIAGVTAPDCRTAKDYSGRFREKVFVFSNRTDRIIAYYQIEKIFKDAAKFMFVNFPGERGLAVSTIRFELETHLNGECVDIQELEVVVDSKVSLDVAVHILTFKILEILRRFGPL